MSEYPEIEKLKKEVLQFRIRIMKTNEAIRKDLFYVELWIDDQSFEILIDDEYSDFSSENKLVDWYLVLCALELYNDCEDILEWSKELAIKDVTQFLDYYKSLGTTYTTIEKILGKIDPQISSYDYTLRTGIAKVLLSS